MIVRSKGPKFPSSGGTVFFKQAAALPPEPEPGPVAAPSARQRWPSGRSTFWSEWVTCVVHRRGRSARGVLIPPPPAAARRRFRLRPSPPFDRAVITARTARSRRARRGHGARGGDEPRRGPGGPAATGGWAGQKNQLTVPTIDESDVFLTALDLYCIPKLDLTIPSQSLPARMHDLALLPLR